MKRAWLVTNSGSGSTSEEGCAAIIAALAVREISLAGQTDFPADDLPTASTLARAGADLVVLYAGDGTINATLSALAEWHGRFLILPGGTMNLLAKALHGPADAAAIIAVLDETTVPVAIPFIEAAGQRAYVGLILGPAASWFRAREAVRGRNFRRLLRAVRLAWERTFRDRVRISGVPEMRGGFQAIFVSPQADGIHLAAIEAGEWRLITQLGWNWLTGDWLAAEAVVDRIAASCAVRSRRDVLALFDGEPVMLKPGTMIAAQTSLPVFIATAKVNE